MTETRATKTAKEMQTTMYASLQDEIKALEVKLQSQLNPLKEVLNEVANTLRKKHLFKKTMNLMRRKHIMPKMTPFLLGYSPLHPKLWGILVTGLVVLSWICKRLMALI